jgi:uncharacterized membrane protein
MEQNRLKSVVFWSALVAQIIAIVIMFVPEFNAELAGKIVAIALEVFVAFGLLNNPTNKTGF